jgi:uncharacterized protein (DUF2147 family)
MVLFVRLAARALGLAVLGMVVPLMTAQAAQPSGPLGTWLTPDGDGVVAIEPCGEALCGRIVGVTRAPGEAMPVDVHGAPQCGLTIITDEKPVESGTWLGAVTDPRTGTTYRAKLWIGRDGNLRMRGFLVVPLLGETKTWRPYTGRLNADCAFG